MAVSSETGVVADEGTMGKRHYALFMLVLVYTLNFIDRNILATLLQSIKTELGVSDQLLGLLAGFTFALFYATLGIPIAAWADRSNRRNIIAWAVAVWSAMTALCGLAQNFAQLALARIGVGVGEAGCSPPAHSLISDYYPPEQRATALGIYSLGIPFGIMFGFFVGGWIDELYGWRSAFFVVGIPGILLAVLFRFTVWEPPRGSSESRVAADERPSLVETFRFLMKRRSFMHLAVGAGLAAFVGYGVITFFPAFLARSHGMESGTIGTWLGLILGIPGGLGIFLGGYCADRFGATDKRWRLWTVTAATLISVPLAVGVYTAGSGTAALWWLVVPIALSNFYQATTFAQTQSLVGLRMRSVASAILLLIINLIGLGLGPWAVGLVSDLLRPTFGVESLRYSLLIISMLGLWSAAHYFRAGQLLPGDLERANDAE